MKKLILWTKIITIVAFFVSYNLDAKIIMQPYLQALTDSSVVVMVECDSDSPAKVEFADISTMVIKTNKTKFSIPTQNRKKTYVHRILLYNLESDKRYQYRVIHGKDTSQWKQFRTFPREGKGFRFAVMGDNRSGPQIFGNIAKSIKLHNPLFSLYLGDLSFDPQYATWKEDFFVPDNLDLISEVPFYNAVGNHEGWEPNTKAFQQSFDVNSPDRNLPYYAFECGDIFFLVLSSMHPLSEGSEQFEFAKKSIATTRKKWKIAALHHPPYSCGGHKSSKAAQEISSKLLEPNKFDIVLAGHSHFYQHNLANGVRYIISGGGGSPLYEPSYCEFTLKSVKDYHYLIFDVSVDKISMKAIDLYGKIIDELELYK